MKYLFILALFLYMSPVFAQYRLTGKVTDAADGNPLSGAVVTANGSTALSGTDGTFTLHTDNPDIRIKITFLSYQPYIRQLHLSPADTLVIRLTRLSNEISQVVVSTGYQQVPKERATGSFEKVNNELLNRRVSTDVLSRLEDVVPGLIVNRSNTNSTYQSQISIRGQSTIFGRPDPLIVIDNFPYEGNINNINPNDVESISVLKDAAAASIWGAKAGNGVIVITTKRGRYGQPFRLSFNANMTVGDKPDLFYQPRMSTADYIERERALFATGYYNTTERSANKTALTPVVEFLIARRDGLLTENEANARIEALKTYDVRNDFRQYLFRKSVQQQYALNLSGGTTTQRYFLSAGFDRNLASLTRNDYDRVTVNGSNTYNLLNNKLEFTTSLYYVQTRNALNNAGTIPLTLASGVPLYPYARLADEAGNALAINHDYRAGFLAASKEKGLLDWQYRPLDEVKFANNTTRQTDYRLNADMSYRIMPGLSANVLYYYGRIHTAARNLQGQETYYTRDLINKLTQAATNGALSYPVPLGSIADLGNTLTITHNLRGQLNFTKSWNNKHDLNAIAGYEVRDIQTASDQHRLYGYDAEHATSKPVDYLTLYRRYYNTASTQTIPFMESQGELTDRYLSYYANAAYTYGGRYTLSGSARTDQSNLFGVNANQRGVPLWSAGLAWNAIREKFFPFSWVSQLKLRATFGYNGNVNKSVTALTTATYYNGSLNLSMLPYAMITNPPNADLRWERVRVINLGTDFGFLANRLSGSVEYYRKSGIDLIGNAPFAPSTGIIQFRGNVANTAGSGWDIALKSVNLNGGLGWTTDIFLSKVSERVTKYEVKTDVLSFLQSFYPLEGKPLYGIYSFPWAGLEPQTGEAQGYLNGAVSKNYAAIITATTPESLTYHGSARPTTFGSIRNTLNWRGIMLSANISYRLGYYFRANSVNYATVLSGQGGHGDYALRWQKPGDEAFTQVPALPATNNGNRNNFYQYSSVLVEKGDHFRLQDINLGYTLKPAILKGTGLKSLQVYLYANNLGILWKATSGPYDPDYPTNQYPPVRTWAAGIKADF